MSILAVLVVVGLVVGLGVWMVGSITASDEASEDTPDQAEVTDASVHPPPRPAQPVPGSQADRERKGHADDPTSARPTWRR